jgi:hypothetical protein
MICHKALRAVGTEVIDFISISVTSIEIQRGLDDFTIDVGATYLDDDPLSRVRTVPLDRERRVAAPRPAR